MLEKIYIFLNNAVLLKFLQ